MKKFLIIIATLPVLVGCADSIVKRESVVRAQSIADNSLEAAAFAVCNASTRGAVKRKFDTPEEEKALDNFCDTVFKNGQ